MPLLQKKKNSSGTKGVGGSQDVNQCSKQLLPWKQHYDCIVTASGLHHPLMCLLALQRCSNEQSFWVLSKCIHLSGHVYQKPLPTPHCFGT